MTKAYYLYAFILILSVLCCSCFTSAKQQLSNFTDEYALLSLKESITEDPYGILTHNWTANTSVCNWFGVHCGVRHRRVTALDLHGMGLVGTIPPEIGNLSFLSFLNFSDNKFHGSLPFELGNVRRLKVMDMRVNNLAGEIPPSLGMLQELQHLDLGSNRLTGKISLAIFNVSSLRFIRLSVNRLIGSLPNDPCNNLASVKDIRLTYNYITGGIPINISNCRNLELLSLGSNNLTGSIAENIGELPLLEELYLCNNQLTGNIPSSLFNVSSLRKMMLWNNSLTGGLPSDICDNIPQIEVIDVFDNQLSGSIPSSLSSCRKLQTLSLSCNVFSGQIPEGIRMLPLIQQLHLGDNNLTGTIPPSISNLTSLEKIGLERAGLSEYGLGGLVSTKVDVYSYGILLMEVFSGKKPTDSMFEADMSLKHCIHDECYGGGSLINVIDPKLLNEDGVDWSIFKEQCFSSVMELALSCTEEVPPNRNNMIEVAAMLKNIRKQFLATIKVTIVKL